MCFKNDDLDYSFSYLSELAFVSVFWQDYWWQTPKSLISFDRLKVDEAVGYFFLCGALERGGTPVQAPVLQRSHLTDSYRKWDMNINIDSTGICCWLYTKTFEKIDSL